MICLPLHCTCITGVQLNSKTSWHFQPFNFGWHFFAFYYLKTNIFFKALLPHRWKTSVRAPNQHFVKQSGLWVGVNRSPFCPKHSWGPSAPQDRCSPAEAVPRNVLAGTMPAHTAGTLLHVLLESFVVVSEQNHPSSFLFH